MALATFWHSERKASRHVYYNESLMPYTPFEVKIKAFNRRGEGPFSQTVVVHSAEEEPTVGPSSINATALSAFEIQVSWECVHLLNTNGIIRGYEIRYWRQHEIEAAADRVRTSGLELTARVSGLRPSTRYHVAVLAYNSAGTGPPSPRIFVTTRKPPPNRPPGNVSWKTEGSVVVMRWDPVVAMHNESAVLGYKVSDLNTFHVGVQREIAVTSRNTPEAALGLSIAQKNGPVSSVRLYRAVYASVDSTCDFFHPRVSLCTL
uniref:Fibronectin type-III domain-containing protein n=1 Tax=Nothobranchius furzeri TaxID=105023 RepID=A0A8C6MAL2_NOTFU